MGQLRERFSGDLPATAVRRELAAKGDTFAVAVVVREEGPGSRKMGDQVIVTADGKLWG